MTIRGSGVRIGGGDGGTPAAAGFASQPRRGTAAAWASANPVLPAGVFGYETDTGVLRVGDGVTAYLSLSSGIRTCKQTAQVTNSTLVTTDVTGMSFAVQAGHLYIVEFWLIFMTAATTTGVGFSATTPALEDTDYWRGEMMQGGSGTDSYYQQSNGTFGTTLVSASVPVQDTPYFAKLEGICTPSADGTIQLRTRSEVDTSLITVLAGGRGRITDCGV